jgi:Mrp family chromosome partitioning ATPase
MGAFVGGRQKFEKIGLGDVFAQPGGFLRALASAKRSINCGVTRGLNCFACASSKGGVGKSTTCVCLAGAFAKAGDTVHIIDLDSNGTVSRWLGDDSLRPRAITVCR